MPVRVSSLCFCPIAMSPSTSVYERAVSEKGSALVTLLLEGLTNAHATKIEHTSHGLFVKCFFRKKKIAVSDSTHSSDSDLSDSTSPDKGSSRFSRTSLLRTRAAKGGLLPAPGARGLRCIPVKRHFRAHPFAKPK